MHISRAGEYGVLGLLHLVRQPAGQTVMIDAVSREVSIPKSFLAKIFQDLAKAGILRSQRGAGGGFALARTAEQITILEIIEAIDGKIALQRCLSEIPDCERRESCALCSLFEQAQDRLKEVFGRTTLLDLAHKQEVANATAGTPTTVTPFPGGISTSSEGDIAATNGSSEPMAVAPETSHRHGSTLPATPQLSDEQSLALESRS
ncbi:MAG: Rrf2 family transcriptional regulator [Verrucomicrobiales bacterium]|nr:Rrf2 family transcriptional regulator [Verrucomicrobiales bacterium]